MLISVLGGGAAASVVGRAAPAVGRAAPGCSLPPGRKRAAGGSNLLPSSLHSLIQHGQPSGRWLRRGLLQSLPRVGRAGEVAAFKAEAVCVLDPRLPKASGGAGSGRRR